MQALMLAAGMGSRLESTFNKCMTTISGQSLFEYTIAALKMANISNLTVVTGYRASELEKFIMLHSSGMEITFVRNEDYAETNNIWSLYLAKEQLARDDTLLLESDLIFETCLLKKLIDFPYSDVAVVASMAAWMDGTTVLLRDTHIIKFVSKEDYNPNNKIDSYKTLNIYKFSKAFLHKQYIPSLEIYIRDFGKGQFYEMILKKLIDSQEHVIEALDYSGKWYEIDTQDDLSAARALFM